jgi:fatty acid desaturase
MEKMGDVVANAATGRARRPDGTGGMTPDPRLLPAPDPGGRILPSGRPVPQWREELRRIPSIRNTVSVVVLYAATVGILAAAVRVGHPLGYAAAFLAMGPVIARFNILMHEAAHRLLFSNRRANDLVGRWLLGFPVLSPTDLYRRGHMAHHRREFGHDEPDLALYRNYPISRASMRRKLLRDALGITGVKLTRGLFRGLRSPVPAVRSQARGIVVTQLVILGLFTLAGHPWLYPLLWLGPQHTVWRVLNRLRGIAEHGGLEASPDRRVTTHAVRQSWLARATIVPYHTGLHLAHHVDPGIPFRRLPALHAELRRSGYLPAGLEYPSYRALWRALASG